MSNIAFIGLGVMGYPMAGHLAGAAHDVVVYNRTSAKADAWMKQHHGRSAPTPRDAAREASFVLSCVGNDADVRAVTLGESGAFAGMKPGAVFIDHTTASARLARELEAEAHARGLGFLDAPVSGGQAGAESGQLSIMTGGDSKTFEKAQAILETYAKALVLVGPAGSGQLTKMVNQICLAGLIQGLAEALHFAKQAGLDTERVLSVISRGAAQSWQMDNRAQTMLEGRFDFGFAVQWMRKDLGICLDEARSNGTMLPVTALVDQFYAEVEARGGRRWDTSSLIARLEGS
ncbi:MAG: NAD-binding protein [Luteitalea sp.]|nr:NAD-binding protein [Luteitalea sp.]